MLSSGVNSFVVALYTYLTKLQTLEPLIKERYVATFSLQPARSMHDETAGFIFTVNYVSL